MVKTQINNTYWLNYVWAQETENDNEQKVHLGLGVGKEMVQTLLLQ